MTFAYALSKRSKNIQIDVYEANPNANEFGAGLNIMPRVLEILQELGLGEELKRYAGGSTTGWLPNSSFRRFYWLINIVRESL